MCELLRQVGDGIVLQLEYLESEQFFDFWFDGGDFIIGEVQLFESAHGEDLLGDVGEFPVGKIDGLAVGALGVAEEDGEFGHL